MNQRLFHATKTRLSLSATVLGIQFQRKTTSQKQERVPEELVLTPPKMETTETLPSSICQTMKTFLYRLASHVIASLLCRRQYPRGLRHHPLLLRQKLNVSILTNENASGRGDHVQNFMMTSLESSSNFSVQ